MTTSPSVALVPVAPTGAVVIARADVATCRGWIARHSRSFYLSSLLLPRPVRHASWALYAFCRRADDTVDEPELAGPRDDDRARLLGRVAALRAGLARVYGDGDARALPTCARDGDSGDAIDRAFAVVARTHGIPRGVPEALLSGMEMDARGERYATWDDLLAYCFRVASTVGLMMTRVMSSREGIRADALLRAAELGVGMQLTNIARDVGEDARRGRVYLPDELLAACGTSAPEVLEAVRRGEAPPALREATRRLLGRADEFYRSSENGIGLLDPGCRVAIASSRYIYAAIGDEVARAGFDNVTRRARTSLPRKLALVGRALPWRFARARPPLRFGEGPADALLGAQVREAGLEVA